MLPFSLPAFQLNCKYQLRNYIPVADKLPKTSQAHHLFNRRRIVFSSGASLVAISTSNSGFKPLPVNAEDVVEDKSSSEEEGKGIVDGIKSLFDPNEKTKSGKVLPKAYLKSAIKVVKTLRESLKEEAKDVAKFRRAADAAKESIRDYLNGWRGQQSVTAEESYVALEKAIRSLANFYSRAGPFAPSPPEVKASILDDLSTAESFL